MATEKLPTYLRLVCHGGKCCGIKHIYSFPNKNTILNAEPARGSVKGAYAQQHSPGKRYFCRAAPKETALERLDRLLAFCKKEQPGGMVEVVLNQGQDKEWGDILDQRGFILGPRFKNSNTYGILQVYWLVNKKEETVVWNV